MQGAHSPVHMLTPASVDLDLGDCQDLSACVLVMVMDLMANGGKGTC